MPQKVLLSNLNGKVQRIFCGPNTSALLFENGDLYVCGSNEYNKLGFSNMSKVTAFVSILHIMYKRSLYCFIRAEKAAATI